MLSESDLDALLEDLNIPPEGVDYVLRTRVLAPTREVGAYAKKSVAGMHFSSLLGETRDYESRSGEAAHFRKWDLDADKIIEYWAQPPSIEIYRHDSIGRKIFGQYTPDALLIRPDAIRVVEIKPEGKIKRRIGKYPNDWKEENGRFDFLPASAHFARIGLQFQVLPNENISRVEWNNLGLIHQVICNSPCPSDRQLDVILRHLGEVSATTLNKAKKHLNLSTTEPLLYLIAHRQIHADLQSQYLTSGETLISTSKKALAYLRKHSMENYGASNISVSLDELPSLKAIERHLEQLDELASSGSRSARRWKAKLRKAGPGVNPMEVIAPKWHRSGNWGSKLKTVVQQALLKHIEDEYVSGNFRTIAGAHGDYLHKAKKCHPRYPAASLVTYRKYAKNADPVNAARSRSGSRGANKAAPSSDVLKRNARAMRPFERVLIDHSSAGMYVIVAIAKRSAVVVKPFVTFVTDEASQVILDIVLTLLHPSRRSDAVAMRRLIRRYGRIPESIHVDRGSDFRSVYMRQLSADFKFHYDWSPSGDSRFNGLIERHIGNFKDEYVRSRPENCIEYCKRDRSRGYLPKDQAVLTFEQLDEHVRTYRNSKNDGMPGSDSESPIFQFERMLREFPMSGHPAELSQQAIIATSVPGPEKERYTVTARGTIKRLEQTYTPCGNVVLKPGTKVEVREDCEDPYRLFFSYDGKWGTALAGRHPEFASLSEIERHAHAQRVFDGRPARDMLRDLAKEDRHRRLSEAEETRFLSRANATLSGNVETKSKESTFEADQDLWDVSEELAPLEEW